MRNWESSKIKKLLKKILVTFRTHFLNILIETWWIILINFEATFEKLLRKYKVVTKKWFCKRFRKVLKKCSEMWAINNLQRNFKKYCFYRCFPEKMGNNFLEILRKFLRHFEIIVSQNLLKIFSKISEFSPGVLEELLGYIELILKKFWKICGET